MPISEVFCGDCLPYMQSLPDNYFDLAVVDPPYGDPTTLDGDAYKRYGGRFDRYKPSVLTEGGSQDTNRGTGLHTRGGAWAAKYQQKERIDWDIAPSQEYFDELFRVSKEQVIWGGNYFFLPPTRCFLVWRKETISEKFSMAMAEYAWTSFNANAKVYETNPQGRKGDERFHATQKPIELYSWIYRLFAKEGDKIFDSMMGSQSSRIAAYMAGLDYYGCEINEEYFRKGNERFDRICKGITRLNNEETILQETLF